MKEIFEIFSDCGVYFGATGPLRSTTESCRALLVADSTFSLSQDSVKCPGSRLSHIGTFATPQHVLRRKTQRSQQ